MIRLEANVRDEAAEKLLRLLYNEYGNEMPTRRVDIDQLFRRTMHYVDALRADYYKARPPDTSINVCLLSEGEDDLMIVSLEDVKQRELAQRKDEAERSPEYIQRKEALNAADPS